MRRKAPPSWEQHESLLDVNETSVNFQSHKANGHPNSGKLDSQKTKQDNSMGRTSPPARKFVVCLVLVFLGACFIVAAWYNDITVLLAIALAVSYAFKRLIDIMLLEWRT